MFESMPEETDDGQGTQERILKAAEALFAERGFETVSLRDITGAADANVAAVNYHFGSKEKLIAAAIARHATPINEERLRLLDERESCHGVDPVPVNEILEAFLSPVISHFTSGEMSERLFCKFMGRLMGERGHSLPESVRPMFLKVADRFSGALRKAVPYLDERGALWRMHFSFGVMSNTLIHGDTLRAISGGRAGHPAMEDLFAQIIEFCAAGFQATSGGKESGN
jgi:AcrR family transcriptional regulator